MRPCVLTRLAYSPRWYRRRCVNRRRTLPLVRINHFVARFCRPSLLLYLVEAIALVVFKILGCELTSQGLWLSREFGYNSLFSATGSHFLVNGAQSLLLMLHDCQNRSWQTGNFNCDMRHITRTTRPFSFRVVVAVAAKFAALGFVFVGSST